jgi:hypothetical protein
MARLALLLTCSICAWAQPANLRPETTLLAEVKEKMLELLGSQPNYTCLETVERTRQAPGGSSKVEDTLRLEVALVDGKEMFAWPGAKQFEDRDIRELVTTGMFGNGNYGLYLRMLFSGAGPEFRYRDEVLVGGARTLRYDFRVHVSRSGYHLSVGDRQGVAGFHGSIYLDAVRADLRRLEMFADDIPPVLELTASEDRVDYARVRIGDEDFLLPVESSLTMESKDSISRNRVRFSGCRRFAGESSLIFDDPEVLDVSTPAVITEVELPVGASLTLEVSSELRVDRASVGDEVTAVLRSDVKRGKETVVKKGAVAKGRIVMLERSAGTHVLGITFQDLEWKGSHARINARFEALAGLTLVSRTRMFLTPDGFLQMPAADRNMRGETLLYRTVR